MIVKPETYKKLVAVKNGKIINIPNMILRKIAPRKDQDKNLNKNSACIVCNFRFQDIPVDWSDNIKAICHPFRNENIFPKHIKTYLFSESDFCDKLTTYTKYRMDKWEKRKFDFVYFTLISREGTRSKGLYLLPLIDEASRKLGLRGLVVDYAVRETSKHKGTIYHKSLKKVKRNLSKLTNLTIDKNKYSCEEVCAIMLAAKFVLLPSDADASPRLLVETLVRNKPSVVNEALYGGWKYIDDNNGAFFHAPTIEDSLLGKNMSNYEFYKDSLISAMNYVLSFKDTNMIGRNFSKEYGFANSSVKLAKIFNEIGNYNYKAVAFKEWKKALEKTAKKKGWI